MREYRVRVEGLSDFEMEASMTLSLGHGDEQAERFLRFVRENPGVEVRWTHLDPASPYSSAKEHAWWPIAWLSTGGVDVKVSGPHFKVFKLAKAFEERVKALKHEDLPPAPFAYEGSPYATA